MSHILAKQPGQRVNASYQVRNDGGQDGQATLDLVEFDPLINDFIVLLRAGPTTIAPTQQIQILTSWLVPTRTGVTYALQIRLFQLNPSRLVASHPFTVNVPAPAPSSANLVAVGAPTIV